MFPHIQPIHLLALLYSDRGVDVWMQMNRRALAWHDRNGIAPWYML